MLDRSRKTRRLTPLLATLLGVGALIVIVAGLELTNTTHFLHRQKAVSGTIPSSTPKSQAPTTSKSAATAPSSDDSAPSQSTSVPASKTQSDNQSQPNGSLVAPFGTFVSNHRPNLSGTPAPSQEQSTCQTTPGASCYITFTSNGVVKTLATQTTDKDGVAIWNWDVRKAGFTEGSWDISVVASLNGNTKTSKDSLTLEVGP